MPYISPEVVEKAREMDLLTYLKTALFRMQWHQVNSQGAQPLMTAVERLSLSRTFVISAFPA